MSRTYSAIRSKHQKHSKVHYQEYLYNPKEPSGYISDITQAEAEAEFFENIGPMRREFRRLADRVRDGYA